MKPGAGDNLAGWIVTFGGLGRLPLVPGTWGTLGAAAVHALVAWQVGTANHPYLLPVLAVLFALAGVAYGPWAERFYGKKDPGAFVLDEAAGYFVAVSFLPFADPLVTGAAAFVLFRILDVLKPFPIGWVQRFEGGVGIVADDVLAGAGAGLLTWLGLWAFAPATLS